VSRFLVVGLGNPGKKYEGTRHNIGFAAVSAFATKHNLQFSKRVIWESKVAEKKIDDFHLILMMPDTFMNRSGRAVSHLMKFFNLVASSLLVIIDDINIPFGRLRLRANGSAGGHRGLQSVGACLQTDQFIRLKIGVGDRSDGDLADYVLSRFSQKEEEIIPKILERVVNVVEIWLDKGFGHAVDYANQKFLEDPFNPSNGESK